MEEDIFGIVALDNERDYDLAPEQADPVDLAMMAEVQQPLQAKPQCTKRLAFKLGCYARHGNDAARDELERAICNLPEKEQSELVESFNAGLRKGRDPDLPEKAASVIRWLEEDAGEMLSSKTKLGRSHNYPRLLMMAYIIGHDGKPFTFAKHRIADALGVPSVTVQNFIGLAFHWQLLDYVCPGVPGLHGAPAWYHLWIDNVRDELEIDDAKERRILDLLKVAK